MNSASFRRRRRAIAVALAPGTDLRPWLPALAAGGLSGFLLYWADISAYDVVFHPFRSLRDMAHGLLEVMVELVRVLPFVVVSTLLAVMARAVLTRRRGGGQGMASGAGMARRRAEGPG